MGFYLAILIIVIVLIIKPYLRFIFKRIIFSFKIKKACRENNFTLNPAHRFWLFGLNNSGHCDFYCISNDNNRTYSIKLFASLHKRQLLDFIEGHKYRWRQYQFMITGRGAPIAASINEAIIHTKVGKIKNLEPIDYLYNLPENINGQVIPIFLVNPTPLAVMRSQEVIDNKSTVYRPKMFEKIENTKISGKKVFDGDLLYNEYLFATQGFIQELSISSILNY